MKFYFIIALVTAGAYMAWKFISKKIEDAKQVKPESSAYTTTTTPATIPPEKENVFYLYWTGGFDSTFRLCEMLINERKVVQPMYVSLSLDNTCETEETCNKLWVRRNRKQEKLAMLKIRKQLNEAYPYTVKTLLPTIYIDKEIDDRAFNQAFETKFYEHNLWPGKRKKHQYLFLAKYAYYHKLYIDCGVLGIHHRQLFAQFLKENLKPVKTGPKNSVNYQINNPGHYLEYLRFPLFGRTKLQCLETAKRYGYDNVLKLSWSCWFPNPTTSKPCGKCPMCKERIVDHPDTVSDLTKQRTTK